MNKKGEINIFNISLTRETMLIIVFIIFFIFLIISGIWFLISSNNKYTKEFQNGENLLNTLTISTQYDNPAKGSTISYISASINGSDINNKIDMTITYTAYTFNKGKSMELLKKEQNSSLSHLTMPFSITRLIKTADMYSQLGNNAQFCVKIDLTYKDVNWIGFFEGYPRKPLESCQPFIGQFQK